ncbi:MAG: ABC transporter ATP-binding protein [bacterium]
MKNNTKLTLKYYWQSIKPYRWLGLGMILSVVVAVTATVVVPLYYKQFFDLLVTPGDKSFLAQSLVWTLGLIALMNLIEWLFWRLATFLGSIFHTRTIAGLNNYCFQYLHKHSFDFFSSNFVGSLVKRVNWFTRSLDVLIDRLMWDLIPLIVRIIFITVVLFRLKPALGWGILLWSLLYMLVTTAFSAYKLTYDIKRSEAETAVSGDLADTVTNSVNVKLFNGYGREVNHFADLVDKVRRLHVKLWNMDNVFDATQGFLMVVFELSVFYYAIILWKQGGLTVGSFVLIQSYLNTIFMQIWGFGRVVRSVYQTMADAEEMTVILSTPHGIRDVATAKTLSVSAGEISFKNVDFAYHETRSIIKKLNLVIKPGERVALIGPSGAGKSTIAKLILRMYELTGGHILIDGQDIARVKQESLWESVSYVPQDPILFHRSLRDNIRYGRPEATDEEIVEAAKKAHCHEFISSLEKGYDTFVGERGIKLSGGERQRVAIARAILRNAPILVLDEATSSLDSEAEHLIQEALENLMQGKTVIVIAHRLSTIRGAHRIIVIDGGGITEEGTHDVLLKKRTGTYRKLWSLQAGGFIK